MLSAFRQAGHGGFPIGRAKLSCPTFNFHSLFLSVWGNRHSVAFSSEGEGLSLEDGGLLGDPKARWAF
jgi:hypothetical protein